MQQRRTKSLQAAWRSHPSRVRVGRNPGSSQLVTRRKRPPSRRNPPATDCSALSVRRGSARTLISLKQTIRTTRERVEAPKPTQLNGAFAPSPNSRAAVHGSSPLEAPVRPPTLLVLNGLSRGSFILVERLRPHRPGSR